MGGGASLFTLPGRRYRLVSERAFGPEQLRTIRVTYSSYPETAVKHATVASATTAAVISVSVSASASASASASLSLSLSLSLGLALSL